MRTRKNKPATAAGLLFLFALLPLGTAQGLACAEQLAPFTSDGCSLFPDGQLPSRHEWLHCCTAHDQAYWQGGTYQQRLDADQSLHDCVDAAGFPEIAEIMYSGVRIGGSPFSVAPYRWGYGWDSLRGYRPLSADEQAKANALLKDSDTVH